MEEYYHPILPLILLDEQSSLKRRKAKDKTIDICTEREGYIFQCSMGIEPQNLKALFLRTGLLNFGVADGGKFKTCASG